MGFGMAHRVDLFVGVLRYTPLYCVCYWDLGACEGESVRMFRCALVGCTAWLSRPARCWCRRVPLGECGYSALLYCIWSYRRCCKW